MKSFLSKISRFVQTELNYRKNNQIELSKLNCWVRLVSGVDDGLILYSNPDFKLFSAAGDSNIPSIYGSSASSGAIGVNWANQVIYAENEKQFGYPKPNITSIEIDEGSGKGLARTASFTITAYTEAQLNQITKYFLEPGFTVFLEWGWNTEKSLRAYNNQIDVKYVTDNQFYKKIKDRRKKTEGNYDSYLGYITGGKIGLSETFWNIEVNLTGFSELPAFLNISDNFKKDVNDFEYGLKFDNVENVIDLGRRRFRTMFNQLPSTRRTLLVKNLEFDKVATNVVNFINFDDTVIDKINSITNGSGFIFITETTVQENSSDGNLSGVSLPIGTKLIGEERFIKFELLMKIISQFNSSYNVGENTKVSYSINTDTTIISAYKNIFSTDKTKLFIPNSQGPNFSLLEATKIKQTTQDFISSGEPIDNSVKSAATKILFPYDKAIVDGIVSDINIKVEYIDDDGDIPGINKDAYTWGFLNDLYVNFDFAYNILNTPNFSLKDGLYQILNGISSAVNGLWNFQIEEVSSTKDEGVVILKIMDSTLTPKFKENENPSNENNSQIYQFDVYGYNSIFMDASFDMDIGGAMMNQIITTKLQAPTNTSSPSVTGKLFATGYTDKILNKINLDNINTNVIDDSNQAKLDENVDTEKIKQQNLLLFLEKISWYPKVELESNSEISADTLLLNVYRTIYDDREALTSIKTSNDNTTPTSLDISIPLPVKFSFSMHGISGIKRGDMFSVKGLPNQYSIKNGFFQVTSLKNTIENMIWKTTIEGEFRTIKSAI